MTTNTAEINITEISSFIGGISPFDDIEDVDLANLVNTLRVRSLRKNDCLPPLGVFSPCVYIVQQGELTCCTASGELVARFAEGDICRELGQLWNCGNEPLGTTKEKLSVQCDEQSVVFCIDCDYLIELGSSYSSIRDYFCQDAVHRLKQKMIQVNDKAVISSTLMNTQISHFYNAPIATINQSASIQQAAILMTEQGHSSLVILRQGTPIGIVTDKDIRRRCVASGLPSTESVGKIMTENMITIDSQRSAYDALMMMTAKQVHHLPVTSNNEVIGMVTSTDLMKRECENAINLISIVHKTSTIEELKEVSTLLPKLQVRLAQLGGSADYVGKSISAVTMAMTTRLIDMAQDKYGQAPVPFAWLASGSQARQEQLVHTDQDNALMICDSMTAADELWFAQLAQFVCDGLVECGFIYCPGNNMAINSTWRQPVHIWQQYFTNWIEKPDPNILRNISLFFDLECMYGDKNLLETVRKQAMMKIPENEAFITHLSQNALKLQPPLGFFRDFVLISDGEHKESVDLKISGIAPIVDLARIFALTQGITTVNTIERIKCAAGTAAISQASADNLIDAFEFIGMLRVKHQAKSLIHGQLGDNYISPKELSTLEREYLKVAFKVIKSIQDSKQANYYNCG